MAVGLGHEEYVAGSWRMHCCVVCDVPNRARRIRGPAEAAADAATRRAVDRHYRSPRIVSISLSRRFSALN